MNMQSSYLKLVDKKIKKVLLDIKSAARGSLFTLFTLVIQLYAISLRSRILMTFNFSVESSIFIQFYIAARLQGNGQKIQNICRDMLANRQSGSTCP
jgi:hypothetical protein